MNLGSFRALLTPLGQQVLAEACDCQPRETDYLRHFQTLSQRYPPALAQAALEIAIQRRRAAAKFPFADRLYFTREALEQASAYLVAAYRAGRYPQGTTVFDLGCAAGGDALALAGRGAVVGVELDPLRLAMARANLAALGLSEQASWLQADLLAPPWGLNRRLREGFAFCDPARREAGRRVFSVERYAPPLSAVAGWRAAFPALGVKLSPGVELAELAGYAAEIEFISVQGELKECVLWFGTLKQAHRSAVLLPGAQRLRLQADEAQPELPLAPPANYLYEPDPAVLRAGLVQKLGGMLGAAQLDPQIAYLTADRQVETPFARCWKVVDWFPFQLKRLRAYLRARRVGRVTIKKRGSPLDPEMLAAGLRLSGENHALLFLTHLRGEPIVIIGETVSLRPQ